MSITFDPTTMVDVAAFGAAPNGGQDASAAIQAAEAVARTAGKELYFEPGTYSLDSTVLLHSGDQWVSGGGTTLGAAGTNSEALATGFAAGDDLKAAAPVTNIRVTGLTIAGNESLPDPASASPLVVIWRASHVVFDGDTFENTPRLGPLLSNVDHTGFVNCAFQNIGYTQAATAAPSNDSFGEGIAFCCSDTNPSVDNFVQNSTFSAIGLDAISATDQMDMTISGNTLANLDTLPGAFWDTKADGSAGVYLSNDSAVTVARNNIADASGNGIDAVNVTGLEISGNSLSSSGGSGIALDSVANVDVLQNTITNNNQLDNHFFFQSGLTISDHIWGSGGDSSSNVYIAQNVITDTQSTKTQNWAIQVNMEADPTNVVINTDNVLAGNIGPGSVGAAGIGQAWVQPWNDAVQTVQAAPQGTPWAPTVVSTPALTATLASGGATSAAGVEDTRDPELTGVAAPLMELELTDNGSLLGSATADVNGRWSFAPQLVDGLHTIDVSEVDSVGTLASASVVFDLKTAPPDVTMRLASSGAQSAAGPITSLDTLVGSGDSGAVVTITEGSVWLGTTTADAGGLWSFAPQLADGTYTLTASETNLAGVVGSASLNFQLDTDAPVVTMQLKATTAEWGSGSATTLETLAGTCDPDATVTISENAGVLGTTTADAHGAWAFTPPLLASGTYAFVASETSPAGVVGSASLTTVFDATSASGPSTPTGDTIVGSTAESAPPNGSAAPRTIASSVTLAAATDANGSNVILPLVGKAETFDPLATGLTGAITETTAGDARDFATAAGNGVTGLAIEDSAGGSFQTDGFATVSATLSGAADGSVSVNGAQTATIALGSGNYDARESSLISTATVSMTAGSGTDRMTFLGSGHADFVAGAGSDTIVGGQGGNTVTFGTGTSQVWGGLGADTYVFHSGDGLQALQTFDAAKGDVLDIDSALKSSLHASSAGGSTLLSFGSAAHGILLQGVSSFDTAQVHWT